MKRRTAVGIAIVGLSLVLVDMALRILETRGVEIPYLLPYILLGAALLAFIGAGVYVFWDPLGHLFGEYKLQFPVVRKVSIAPQPVSEKSKNKNLQEVSEHIVKHIQSVTEQLEKVSAGAYTSSLKWIFKGILGNNPFSVWCQNKPLVVQLTTLFDRQLDQLFNGFAKYRGKIRSFGIDLTAIYSEIRVITLTYRFMVSSFIQLLNSLEKEGAPTVWENEPLRSKIYNELRDNYDELMQRIKSLKVYVASEDKDLLPSDDQLTKFDRIPGIIGS
ncbi:MAG: hypothetical protein ACOC7P_03240 [Chloroflexota bacterium]